MSDQDFDLSWVLNRAMNGVSDEQLEGLVTFLYAAKIEAPVVEWSEEVSPPRS